MIRPTTILLGEKASQLFKSLAAENNIKAKFFFTKIVLREARAEAAALSSERLKERLRLISEVEDEWVDMVNNPPKAELWGFDYSTRPKAIYAKIWTAHKRLAKRGWSEEQIHEHCLKRYGMDIDITENPNTSPKKNPDWVGGGKVAAKIKEARKYEGTESV